ncbi:unnamed protein product [Ostreobium quekettii]|uniref:Zinc finger, RING/FYVE/PHD-type n=1 Tax=Ostreobium quekettii TaxID=121088 RepID=A0A8S1IUV1_9CHLO|nr:unnamed protein product [Ostreobium quekettii]|eukprot:evm.model.scf_151.11 EVM.evm.TU.scf_151.11   scf_151:79129-85680(+)
MSKGPFNTVTPKAVSDDRLAPAEDIADGSDRVQRQERLDQLPRCGGMLSEPRSQGGSPQRRTEHRGRGSRRGNGRAQRGNAVSTEGGEVVRAGGVNYHGLDGDARAQGSGSVAVALSAPSRASSGRHTRGSSQRSYVSANHLLGFKFDRSIDRGRGTHPRQSSNPRRRTSGYGQRYNKDEFLQANYRFLVSDAVDVNRFAAEPDLMFDWEDVVQVEMQVTSPVKCPISLDSPPLCPQLTPCGHVFGFPSIMQLLLVHGGPQLKVAAPCPFCFRKIAARELRMVVIHEVKAPRAGETVRFELLKRPKNSIIPQKVHGSRSVDERGECTRFTKFTTIADPMHLWRAMANELAEYAAQVVSEGGTEAQHEAQAVYAAMDALAARAGAWTAARAEKLAASGMEGLVPEQAGHAAESEVKEVFTAKVASAASLREQQEADAVLDELFPALPGASGSSVFPTRELADPGSDDDRSQGLQSRSSSSIASTEDCDHHGVSPGNQLVPSAGDPQGDYYFYQAADGQLLFLHPVNMKCLLKKYGDYLACPPTLEGKVVELEDVAQDEASRKRFRHLAHLPNRGTFNLAEIDLSHLLPDEFLEPIVKREEQRRARMAAEQERSAREEALARAAELESRPPSLQEFRSMPKPCQGNCSSVAEPAVEESDERSCIEDGGVSFARITKMGIAASWGVTSSGPNPMDVKFPALSTSPGATLSVSPQNVWCHKQRAPGGKVEAGPGAGPGRGWPAASGHRVSAAELVTPGAAAAGPATGKKAKKASKTLLFSTSQRRGH